MLLDDNSVTTGFGCYQRHQYNDNVDYYTNIFNAVFTKNLLAMYIKTEEYFFKRVIPLVHAYKPHKHAVTVSLPGGWFY